MQVSVLDAPDIIVTSSLVLDRVQEALQSPYLDKDYVWSEAANNWWYRNSPPSPALFRLYEDLANEREYRLRKLFEIPVPEDLAAEFITRQIRIYERRRQDSGDDRNERTTRGQDPPPAQRLSVTGPGETTIELPEPRATDDRFPTAAQ